MQISSIYLLIEKEKAAQIHCSDDTAAPKKATHFKYRDVVIDCPNND
jgi:hypothetical protein